MIPLRDDNGSVISNSGNQDDQKTLPLPDTGLVYDPNSGEIIPAPPPPNPPGFIPLSNPTPLPPVPVSIVPDIPNVNVPPPVSPLQQVNGPPPLPTPISNVPASISGQVGTAGSISFPITITIASTPFTTSTQFAISVNVLPAIPVFAIDTISVSSNLVINPIPLSLNTAIMNVINELIGNKIETFFDDDRQGKTIVNFGDDFQTLIVNWIADPSDDTGTNVLVKLYEPLPDEVTSKTQVWISRILSPTVIDRVWAQYTPAPQELVYLRPANKNITVVGRQGASIDKATLANLLSSQSLNEIRPSDPVLEQWYTSDINSVELNTNFGDYREFVFFGSAQHKLDAFVQKLGILENLDELLSLHSSSLSLVTGSITSSLTYPIIQQYGDDRIDMLRSFDPYERFLYYDYGVPYSASLTWDDTDEIAYSTDATWPKINGTSSVYSVTSSIAIDWYVEQSAIATAYDQINLNNLSNNLPAYLQNDIDSSEFLTFVNMIGHQFDILKSYIDNMSNLYNRDSDPKVGLSPDLVWNIAQSVGVDLPNPSALASLNAYTIGSVSSPKVYREIIAETWKRFLHNQIFMMKTKGTKTSLRALANSYGILPTTLQIKEGNIVGPSSPQDVYEEYDEQTNALSFNTGSYITFPWSTLPTSASTLEVRFATTIPQTTILLQADNKWAVVLSPTVGLYGTVKIISGSTVMLQSEAFEIFSGDYYNTIIRYQSSGASLQVKKAIGYEIVEDSMTTESSPIFSPIFNSSSHIFLGGSGSAFLAPTFSGFVDEFRIWSEALTDATIDLHVRYPGLYNGNSATSARDSLLARLSFNIPSNLGIAGFINNESPYPTYHSGSGLTSFTTSNFLNIPAYPNNMSIVIREVARQSPTAASTFSTNNTIVVAPPTFVYISGSTIPILSRQQSIVSLDQKYLQNKSTNVVGFYFTLTEAINDSIIRSIGNINLQDMLGDPSEVYSSTYSALKILDDLYWSTYAYEFNVNRFTDFVGDILTPMFEQARNLVPARAKLISGIVHEPHILERSKVVIARPLQFDQNITFEAVPVSTSPDNVSGEYDTKETEIDVIENIELESTQLDYLGCVTESDISTITSDFDTYDGWILPSTSSGIFSEYDAFEGDFITNDLSEILSGVNVAYDQQHDAYGTSTIPRISAIDLNQYREDAKHDLPVVSFDPYTNLIEPYSNFDYVQSYTYFYNSAGTVQIEYIKKIPFKSTFNDKGAWTAGVGYSVNDTVIQNSLDPDALNGNGKIFYCVTTDFNFISQLPPYLDTQNWRQMLYITVATLLIKLVTTDTFGNISFVDTIPLGSVPFVGYSPLHYKFTRDYSRGIINHQWLGCLQDDTTTTDGRPAVEIIPSAGDTLVVNNSGAPIQPVNNPSGLLLDVK